MVHLRPAILRSMLREVCEFKGGRVYARGKNGAGTPRLEQLRRRQNATIYRFD